jgi:hypothetical protein
MDLFKKNPYNIEALAYLDYKIPDKIREFLDKFADKEKVFDTILLNKLEGFYDDLGWKLVTNPYINQFFILMNKFIKIFDNSINFNLADKIEEQLTDIHFPYNYLQNVTYGNSSNTYKPGFLHEFFDFENKINNVYTSFLNQILYSFCFTQQINILHYFKGRVFMHIPSLNQDKI